MASVGDDVQSLAVSAAGLTSNFSKSFDTATLQAMHPTATPEALVSALQVAFQDSSIIVDGDGRVVRCASPTASFAFELDPTSVDVQKVMFDSLQEYHHAYVHLKETEQVLQREKAEMQKVKTKVRELKHEEDQLTQQISRCRTTDKQNETLLAELEGKITARGGAPLSSLPRDDPQVDALLCRAPNPLGRKERKDVSKGHLRLIKSTWCSDEAEGQQPWNTVVRPYTTSDFAEYTRNLSDVTQAAVWTAMQKIDEWDYDVFALQEAMSGDTYGSLRHQPRGGSLLVTTYALFFRHNLIRRFSMDESVLLNWISIVEGGYHANPYHNSMHAADVLHITHYILSSGGLATGCRLTEVDIFAALFSAAIHDFDHPGINNSFHIRARTHYAMLYNDRSVLENHHVASVFELMKLSRYNILATLTEEQRKDLRETVIEMVLATDMGLHSKYVKSFKGRLQETRDLSTKREDARLAMSMALKMADISNCGRPLPLYLKWSGKISDEFYMQGDRERHFGFTISPYMNRQNPAVAQGQISFMSYVIVPLFEVMTDFLPAMRFSMDLVDKNKQHWLELENTA